MASRKNSLPTADISKILGLSGQPRQTAREGQTDETAEKYAERFRRLINQWQSSEEASRQSLTTFTDWIIIDVLPRISPSTWRQYRSSVLFSIMDLAGDPMVDDCIHRLECLPSQAAGRSKSQRRMATQNAGAGKAPLPTGKIKQFPFVDILRLNSALANSRSRDALHLSRLLVMGRMLGLRPTEWFRAELLEPYTDEDGNVMSAAMRVRNAKNSNSRACGSHRFLDLTNFSEENLDCLRFTIRDLEIDAPTMKEWRRLYENCRKLLQRTCKALWPRRKRHYCLYSTRHGFSADAKMIYSPVETAALMGHASTRTASSHYGRHRVHAGKYGVPFALESELPLPSAGNMAQVREVPCGKAERQAHYDKQLWNVATYDQSNDAELRFYEP